MDHVMVLQRLGVASLALFLAGASARAEVRLVMRADGRKVIYNLPGSGKGVDDLAWLARQRNRPSRFDSIIERYADRWNVDPVLVKAVITVESNFDPSCVSRKGARGLMQLMPDTARRFAVAKIHDPEQNIRGGVEYLALLLEMFDSDLPRVLAAYNAGENAVIRYGGIPPYDETESYVRRALTVFHGRPWGGGGTVAFGKTWVTAKLGGGFRGAEGLVPGGAGKSGAQAPTQPVLNLR